MLEDYSCKTAGDYENALKEIMQEIALLGLWRAKFYEHALFYGGSALRILYGLPRFSEDLDFSLLAKSKSFDLTDYHNAIQAELESFGFKVKIESKEKNATSQIESAFIKASTRIHFIKIAVPEAIAEHTHTNQMLKIKLEVDTNPPGGHGIEVIDIFRPIPFQVKTMPLTDLFAGKIHAVLARQWEERVKGRDFFDYLWYLGKQVPLNLHHLEKRLVQSGHWNKKEKLTQAKCIDLLTKRFNELNFEKAKADVYSFLGARERDSLALWTNSYFFKSIKQIQWNESSSTL